MEDEDKEDADKLKISVDEAPSSSPNIASVVNATGALEGTWANRHPWMLGAIFVVVSLLAGYLFNELRHSQDPLAVNQSKSLGSFNFRLSAIACERSTEPSPYGSTDPPKQLDTQTCTAQIAVRNNGKSASNSFALATLRVGDESYESNELSPFVQRTFPNQSAVFKIAFDIPLRVNPTKLIISPSAGDESYWSILPFYTDRIVYDVG